MRYLPLYLIVFSFSVFTPFNTYGQDFLATINDIKVLESDSIKLIKFMALAKKIEQDEKPEVSGILLHEIGVCQSNQGEYEKIHRIFP